MTDTRHNPIHNLTAADFKVLEDGQPQAIKTLEEHHSWDAAAPLPQVPRFPPGTFTNYTNAPLSGALNILLLDTLNTPMSAQADVRSQVLQYLKQMRPGTRMAIFGLTSRLILLQGFASDPGLLSDVRMERRAYPIPQLRRPTRPTAVIPAMKIQQRIRLRMSMTRAPTPWATPPPPL